MYEFGPFYLEPVKRILLRDGEPVALPPKAFDTLLVLIENVGQVVERNVLMEKLWPDTCVEESNLNVQISFLRKALGEHPNEHRYIVTVPRRGYSFVAEINRIENDTGDKLAVEDITRAEPVEGEEDQKEYLQEEVHLDGKAASEWFSGSWKRRLTIALATLALITKLSNIDQIIVRPTSAILKYGDAESDPVTAGRELEVDLLLEGKIQNSGDRIRVTVQMLRMRDGAALWADSFDEKNTNIFAVEDSISRRVAEVVRTNLNVEEKKTLGKHYTENTRAYQAYIKGRYHWNKRTGEELIKATVYFEEAIEHDPTYALAYAGLADSYNLLSIYGGMDPKDVYPKAKEAATKAIEIDDTLAEAYTSRAYAKMRYDWDWAGAEEDFKHSLSLAPGYATAHHWYGEYFMLIGRSNEAKAEFKRALELDPLSVIMNSDLAWLLYYVHDYDAAIDQARKTLDLDREFIPARLALAETYTQKGMYEEALKEFENNDIMKSYWARIAYIFAISGRRDQALGILKEKARIYKDNPRLPHPLAVIYAGLLDKDHAIELLEKSYQAHLEAMLYLKVDPRFDLLHSDARFQELLRRIGLS